MGFQHQREKQSLFPANNGGQPGFISAWSRAVRYPTFPVTESLGVGGGHGANRSRFYSSA